MTSTVDRIVADALRVTLSHPAACGCAGCLERERRDTEPGCGWCGEGCQHGPTCACKPCRERARTEARARVQARAREQASLGERGR